MTPFKQFPNSPSYEVSADGDIRRIGKLKCKSPANHSNGYLTVTLCENGRQKTWRVHIVVCTTFHGEKPSIKHAAAHRDGNKTNNKAPNLRWATYAENEGDKIVHGRVYRRRVGEIDGISESYVRKIVNESVRGS